jgi:hypothetical protein
MNPPLDNEFLKRPPGAEKPDPSLRLTALEWRLWVAVDGLTSLAELARAWEVNPEALAEVAGRLRDAGYLVRAEFTLAEYQAAVQAAEAAAPSAEPVARKYSASIKRRAPAIATPAGNFSASGPSNAVGVGAAVANANTNTNTNTATSAAIPAAPAPGNGASDGGVSGSANGGAGFALRPLINFIIQQAGGGTMGQLAVYRVFCQVPNELLLKSRITSLNLVGDNFVVQDATLKNRLLEATRTVLGVEFR